MCSGEPIFHIVAIGFDHRGKVLGSARNQTRFKHRGGGLHAEQKLLQKYGAKNIKSIMVVEIRNGNVYRDFEVCSRCQKMLAKYKIKVKKGEHNYASSR